MKKQVVLFLFVLAVSLIVHGQQSPLDSLQAVKTRLLRMATTADSVRIENLFVQKQKMLKQRDKLQYPLINAGPSSGVLPVKGIDEVPSPRRLYKLLFELTYSNPAPMADEVNAGLLEITRIINLHVAAGIPVQHIRPVIVVHAKALHSLGNDAAYQQHFNSPNPNSTLVQELEQKAGARFIVCGQALQFLGYRKEQLLPGVKLALTAQVVLADYQLQGYVHYAIGESD
jgi:intracellular sulfur oxidation DsrE/DsrF family protein